MGPATMTGAGAAVPFCLVLKIALRPVILDSLLGVRPIKALNIQVNVSLGGQCSSVPGVPFRSTHFYLSMGVPNTNLNK